MTNRVYISMVFFCLFCCISQPVSGSWYRDSFCSPSRLTDVWCDSASDAWATGIGGTLMHWNGVYWTPVDSGTDHTLYGIWGLASDDVYAVGEDHILHWNGLSWSTELVGETSLQTVWAADSGMVFVAGGNSIYFGDHTGWSTYFVPDADGISACWGSSESDVYFLASNSKYVHYDGITFTTHIMGFEYQLSGIWGFDANNIYICGYNQDVDKSLIMNWDGSTWSEIPQTQTASLYDIWGAAPDDIYAVGGYSYGAEILHFDGTSWSSVQDNDLFFKLFGVFGVGTDFLFGVGDHIAHYQAGMQSPIDLEFDLFDCMVSPGESFKTYLLFSNTGTSQIDGSVLCALEVFGEYFFYPSWSTSFDFHLQSFPVGAIGAIHIFPEFTWPDTGTSFATDLRFWGLVMDSGMSDILSNLAVISWGYGP